MSTDDARVVEVIYDGRRILKEYDAEGKLVRMRVEPHVPAAEAPEEPASVPTVASASYRAQEARVRARKAADALRRTLRKAPEAGKDGFVRVPVDDAEDARRKRLAERFRTIVPAKRDEEREEPVGDAPRDTEREDDGEGKRPLMERLRFPTREKADAEEGLPGGESTVASAPDRPQWRVLRQDVIVITSEDAAGKRFLGRFRKGVSPADAADAVPVEVPAYAPVQEAAEADEPDGAGEGGAGFLARFKRSSGEPGEAAVDVERARDDDAGPRAGILARLKPSRSNAPEAGPANEDAAVEEPADPAGEVHSGEEAEEGRKGLLARFKRSRRADEPDATQSPEVTEGSAPAGDGASGSEPARRGLLARLKREPRDAGDADTETGAPSEPEDAEAEPRPRLLARLRRKGGETDEAEIEEAPAPAADEPASDAGGLLGRFRRGKSRSEPSGDAAAPEPAPAAHDAGDAEPVPEPTPAPEPEVPEAEPAKPAPVTLPDELLATVDERVDRVLARPPRAARAAPAAEPVAPAPTPAEVVESTLSAAPEAAADAASARPRVKVPDFEPLPEDRVGARVDEVLAKRGLE